jgi:hypothetical protein
MNQLPNHIRAWKKPAKKSEKSKLVEKLDSVFSEFVRLRDSDEHGIVECITCTSKKHWRDTDCGHYQDRDHMATRWDEKNCNGQCLECNRYFPCSKEDFAVFINQRHGSGTSEILDRRAKSTVQWEDHELKKMYEYYRDQVKILKDQKGFI